MMLDQLHDQRNQIILLAQKYRASKIKVFGSVARGEDQLNSDVDFLVSFDSGYDMFKQRMPLAEELSKLIGRKIDLVVEHELNKHIRDCVLMEAKNI